MLRFRGVDLQDENVSLDLAVGYAESPDVRGEDDIIPGAAGREPGTRRADVRRIVLQGHVRGTGGTAAERAESWRAATDAMLAAFDMTQIGTLEVGPAAPGQYPDAAPYLGLSADQQIADVRCIAQVGGPVQAHMSYQTWSFELQSIASPPEWEASS